MANPCKWRDTIYPSQTECAQAAGVSARTVSGHLTRNGHLNNLGVMAPRRDDVAELGAIANRVAADRGMEISEILNRSRHRDVSEARQEAMRQQHEAGFSLPQIGRFWGLHHTTVLHGVRVASQRRSGSTGAQGE